MDVANIASSPSKKNTTNDAGSQKRLYFKSLVFEETDTCVRFETCVDITEYTI